MRDSSSLIFAVDDSAMDAELLAMALNRATVGHRLEFFVEGEAVVNELRRRVEAFTDLPLACLLDIKMPGLSGLQVLEWIRKESALDGMAVIMVTSSNHPDDLNAARRLGAQCYLVKFPKPEELRAVIAAAESYAAEPDPRAIFVVACNQFVAVADVKARVE